MAISVQVSFLCKEITGNAREGEYIIPEHSTVSDLMECAAKESGTFQEGYMEDVLFILNGKLAKPDTKLQDSDRLKVAAVIYGG